MTNFSRTWTRHLFIACCLALLAGTVACDDTSDPQPDATGGDATDAADIADTTSDGGDADAENDAGEPCEPGEIIACERQNTQSILQCPDDGRGEESGSCPPETVCRNAECVEVSCIPNTERRCDGNTPEVCNEEGTELVAQEPCAEGEQCESGRCLNRCENAAQTNSYIGCEYWAVELENHLLFNDSASGDPIPMDKRPPFALVLSNPSDSYQAEVTVWKDPETPAVPVGSREVFTEARTPDVVPQTVESELLNENGQRLLGPIDRELVNVPMPPGSLLTLILPQRQVPFGSTSLTQKAYRVESSQPIVAYQFNPYCCNYNYTNDASLLLPTSALSGNYMMMGYPNWDSPGRREGDDPQSATVSVLATEPDTQVTVQVPEPNKSGVSYDEALYPTGEGDISGPDAQGRITATLQPHEVLNVAGKEVGVDLTGARVDATKPVSVFGGHSCAYVPFASPACDHLESQLFPMETWGESFVASPLKIRGTTDEFTREATYWKFLARKDGTRIETGIDLNVGPNGVQLPAGENVKRCSDYATVPESGVFTLDAGESCEFGTKKLFAVSASEPIQLGAFLSGQNSVGDDVEHAGDPAFFLVPPQEQYRNEYTFLTPATYFVDYVTVTMPSQYTQLVLDGEMIDISQNPTYSVDDDSGWATVHLEVEAGPHRIASGTVAFGIVAYGYHDYVSYAYTGGLDLTKREVIDAE
jgi:hypothetical protein